jgi:hypothetical protein
MKCIHKPYRIEWSFDRPVTACACSKCQAEAWEWLDKNMSNTLTAKEARSLTNNTQSNNASLLMIRAMEGIKASIKDGKYSATIYLEYKETSWVEALVEQLKKLGYFAEYRLYSDQRDGSSYYVNISW